MSKILIELARIQDFFDLQEECERITQIQRRKQAIYQYRNQFLTEYLGSNIKNEAIDCTEHGKPYLSNYPHFYFNHSHSQKHYALATSTQVKDLGIDIEDLDRQVKFEALAKHAFHPQEWMNWQDLEFDPIYWFKVWTTKEAVLKASGLGIRMSLKDLNTQVHPSHHGGVLEHPELGVFAFQNIQLAQVMMTVAWRSERSCKGFNWPEIQVNQH